MQGVKGVANGVWRLPRVLEVQNGQGLRTRGHCKGSKDEPTEDADDDDKTTSG